MTNCCPHFEKGMQEITAQQIFCERQSAAPLYTSPQFSNCPFCGTKIILEDRRKEDKSVRLNRRKINLSVPQLKINNGLPIQGANNGK